MKRNKSKIKPLVYGVVAFFLSLVLFLLSICTVLEMTVFSQDYMLSVMGNNGYYEMVKSEMKTELKNLCNASGLSNEFAENFVDDYGIDTAVQDYIASFYSGDNTLVNTTVFKQKLYEAVDVYIKDNNIKTNEHTNEYIANFVNEATEIYVNQISITFFSTIANYIDKTKTPLLIITLSLAAAAVILIVLIVFTNRFKHRRFRYICYGLSGGFLSVTVLPTIVFLSGKIEKVNITTRSLYNLFTNYINGVLSSFYLISAVLLLAAVGVFVLYVRTYQKALKHTD